MLFLVKLSSVFWESITGFLSLLLDPHCFLKYDLHFPPSHSYYPDARRRGEFKVFPHWDLEYSFAEFMGKKILISSLF